MPNRWKMLKNTDPVHFWTVRLIVVVSCFFSVSCSENQPEINQVFWQINKYHDVVTGEYYDRLSLFVEAKDEDGAEDLKTIYLINDSEEILWKVTDKNWVFKSNKEEQWFGLNSMAMHDYSAFPPGKYRVVFIDDAGERQESEINIGLYDDGFEEKEFPSAQLSNNMLSFSSNTEVVWFYNTEMKYLSEVQVKGRSEKSISVPEKAAACYVYRYDRAGGYALVSGPYNLVIPGY